MTHTILFSKLDLLDFLIYLTKFYSLTH